uniref:Uncharacterized protein n=1 Tax=Triticum urartu TaxID=4572 RepID=A0A8R7K1M7_TRIUA
MLCDWHLRGNCFWRFVQFCCFQFIIYYVPLCSSTQLICSVQSGFNNQETNSSLGGL